MKSQMSRRFGIIVKSVHLVSKGGIRGIVELENLSVMLIRRIPETIPTSGSASIMSSPVGAICGLAAIASLASGQINHTAETILSHGCCEVQLWMMV